MQQYYSFRNHRLMQVKNECWGTLLPDLPFIVVREFGSLAWLLLREPKNAGVLIDLLRSLPKTFRKRRVIMRRRRAAARSLRPWLRGRWGPENSAEISSETRS